LNELTEKLHAAVVFRDHHPFRQMVAAKLDEALLPAGIECPHPPEMGGEIALLDEVGEGGLKQKRRRVPGSCDDAIERLRELDRHDHEPEPERAEQRLAEGT